MFSCVYLHFKHELTILNKNTKLNKINEHAILKVALFFFFFFNLHLYKIKLNMKLNVRN